MSTATELINMKQEMSKIETAKNQAEGKHAQLMQTLKDDFGFTDTEKAAKSRDKEVEAIEAGKEKLEKGVEELKENYEWGL